MKSHPDGTHYDPIMTAIQRGVEAGEAEEVHPVRKSAQRALRRPSEAPVMRPARIGWWTQRRIEGLVIIAAAFLFLVGLDIAIGAANDLTEVLR